MENQVERGRLTDIKDLIVSLVISGAAAVLYFVFATDSIPVGVEGVITSWVGLSDSSYVPFPTAGAVAGLMGMSRFFAPVFGGLSVFLLFHVVNVFIKECFGPQYPDSLKASAARIGGLAAAVIFMLTPCVFSSATHLGPVIFDTFLALSSLAVFIPFLRKSGVAAMVAPFLSGIILAFGVADMLMLAFLLPMCGILAWVEFSRKGKPGYIAVGLFLLGFFISAIVLIAVMSGSFGDFTQYQKEILKSELVSKNWFYAIIFAVVPFIISLFACPTVFGGNKIHSVVTWIFHFCMSVVAVLAVASPLSPSSVLGYSGLQPSLIASAAAGMSAYVLVYWLVGARVSSRLSVEDPKNAGLYKSTKTVGSVGCIGFSLVMALSLITSFVVESDFKDELSINPLSEKIITDMGGRTWLVTDGLIDDDVKLAARAKGVKLNLISLNRESDDEYIKTLAETVLREKLGGEELSKELADKLSRVDGINRQRLVPFIEHWFKNDPAAVDKAAVWGAPQLWMSALNSDESTAPGLYFFVPDTGKETVKVGDWMSEWPRVKNSLRLADGWGSYRSEINGGGLNISKRERKLRNLRRHIGFMAVSQGNYHHFKGLEHFADGNRSSANECFDKAFELYNLVWREIDPDNVVALYNIKLLAEKNAFKKAIQKRKEIDQEIEAAAKDPNRRYRVEHLLLLYGTICDPEFMMHYANSLSKGGRHSQAVFQMRRAIDLIPSDQRRLAEMNILVHYLSGGSDKEKSRAREICLSEIKRNPSNRAALVRLSQLEALDGNVSEAVKCLERALAGVENDPKYAKMLAQKHLLKNELYEAEMVLRRAIDADPNDIQAWALLTHVLIQNVDMIKDASVNTNSAAKKDKALKEIEENILPKMKSLVKDRPVEEAVYRSTRALVLMRKGGDAHIREARDSFDAVANSGRGSTHTGDMILTLDMQLNDKAHAEARAMRILAANPDDSLANYIMGSISLHRGENNQAEKYLRKSVSGKRIALLAYNDLAEVLRRLKKFDEAEKYARKAVEITPNLYVAWETLGSILMDTGKSFEEAEKYIQKACDLSKDEQGGAADVRMLISLARVQKARGQMKRAKSTMRMVQSRMNELTDYERREFEELMRSVK